MFKRPLTILASILLLWPSLPDGAFAAARPSVSSDLFADQALAQITLGSWKPFAPQARAQTALDVEAVRDEKTQPPYPLSFLIKDLLERPYVNWMYYTYPWRTGRWRRSDPIRPEGDLTLHILASFPHDFKVRWGINEFMEPGVGRVNQIKAVRQWEALMKILHRMGVQIDEIPQGSKLHDMVFTANGGVVDGNTFIPPHFAKAVRQKETDLFIEYFKGRGYAIADIAKGSVWEGEGDTLVHDDRVHGITRFGGYGDMKDFRSNLDAQRAVAEHLGQHFVGLELVHPSTLGLKHRTLYHLDTCFFPLGDGKSVMYYPEAFSPESRALIERYVTNPIPIGEEDAMAFACNGVTIGPNVIINKATDALKATLAKEGFNVIETPTTEFLKSGGSVKCLILLLNGWLRPRPASSNSPPPTRSDPSTRSDHYFLTSV